MYRGGGRGGSPLSFVLGGFVPFLAGLERGWAFSVPKKHPQNPPSFLSPRPFCFAKELKAAMMVLPALSML